MEIGHLKRFKLSEPFSQSLNSVIKRETDKIFKKGIQLVETSLDYSKGHSSLEEYLYKSVELLVFGGKIAIYTGDSGNNIFGDSSMNILFRFWHDYIHLSKGLSFDLEGEIKTYEEHILSCDNQRDKDLLFIEIVRQTEYYYEKGYFPSNQRGFCIENLIQLEESRIYKDYPPIGKRVLLELDSGSFMEGHYIGKRVYTPCYKCQDGAVRSNVSNWYDIEQIKKLKN